MQEEPNPEPQEFKAHQRRYHQKHSVALIKRGRSSNP